MNYVTRICNSEKFREWNYNLSILLQNFEHGKFGTAASVEDLFQVRSILGEKYHIVNNQCSLMLFLWTDNKIIVFTCFW